MLSISKPFTKQPQNHRGIDWSNPLTHGLVSYLSLAGQSWTDLARHRVWTPTGTNARTNASTNSGRGIDFGSTGGAAYASTPWSSSLNTNHTIAFWYTPKDVSTTTVGLVSLDSTTVTGPTSTNPHLIIQRNSADLRAYLGGAYIPSAASVFAVGQSYLVVWVFSGNTCKFFVNGQEKSSVSGYSFSNTPQSLFVGSGYQNGPNGQIQDFAFWYGRALNAAQVSEYYSAPWKIIRPSRVLLYYPTSGTQTYTYTATGGMTFGGTATEERHKVQSVSGGLQFGGSASVSYVGLQTLTVTPSGGITFGGSSAQSITRPESVSGGLQFGGSATVETHESVRTVTPSGGITFGGSASVSFPSLATLFPYRRFIYGRKGLLDRKISRQ